MRPRYACDSVAGGARGAAGGVAGRVRVGRARLADGGSPQPDVTAESGGNVGRRGIEKNENNAKRK